MAEVLEQPLGLRELIRDADVALKGKVRLLKQIKAKQRENARHAAPADLPDAVKERLQGDARQLASFKQQLVEDNEAFYRDHAALLRVQRAMESASTWEDAGTELLRSATVASNAADQHPRSNGGPGTEAAAALFSVLHRTGIGSWSLGRRSSADSATLAPSRAASAAAGGDLAPSPLPHHQQGTAASSRGASSAQSGPRASSTDGGDQELLALQGYEGPLSRSLVLQRQRTVTPMLGGALDRVPEGDREGAESASPRAPTASPPASAAPPAGISARGMQLLRQLRSPRLGREAAQEPPQQGEQPATTPGVSPLPPASLLGSASPLLPQRSWRRTSDASAAAGALQPAPTDPSPELGAATGPLASTGRSGRPRSTRTSTADGGASEAGTAGGLAEVLTGHGPLMHSMAVRQSMTLSQLLGGDEDTFDKMLASALAGDAGQPTSALRASRRSLSPQTSGAVRCASTSAPTASGPASSSPSRLVSGTIPAAPMGSIAAWGSGLAAGLLPNASLRRSTTGGPLRTATTAAPVPAPMPAASAQPMAAGAGEELLRFDLLDQAAALAASSHRQVEQIEARLHLPRTDSLSEVASTAAPSVDASPERRGTGRRRLWEQPPQAAAEGLPMSPAAARTASTALQDCTPVPASPVAETSVRMPTPTVDPGLSPVPFRRHTVADGADARQRERWQTPPQELLRPPMDILGRRASAPGDAQRVHALSPGGSDPLLAAPVGAAAAAHHATASPSPLRADPSPPGSRRMSGAGSLAAAAMASAQQAPAGGAGFSSGRDPLGNGLVRRSMNLEEAYKATQGELNPMSAALARVRRGSSGDGDKLSSQGSGNALPPRPRPTARAPSFGGVPPPGPGPLSGGHKTVVRSLSLAHGGSSGTPPPPGSVGGGGASSGGGHHKEALRRSPSTGWEALGLPSGPRAPLADPFRDPARNTNKYAQSWFGPAARQAAAVRRISSNGAAALPGQLLRPAASGTPPPPAGINTAGTYAPAEAMGAAAAAMAGPSSVPWSPAGVGGGGHVVTAVDLARRASQRRISSAGSVSPGTRSPHRVSASDGGAAYGMGGGGGGAAFGVGGGGPPIAAGLPQAGGGAGWGPATGWPQAYSHPHQM